MKKSVILTIILLMSIALIGLTSFQLYWINNAIELNKKAFKKNVITSLNQVVSGLERREVARMAYSKITSFFNISDQKYRFFYGEKGNQVNGERRIYIGNDSLRINEQVEIFPSPPPPPKRELERAKSEEKQAEHEQRRLSHEVRQVIIDEDGDTLTDNIHENSERIYKKSQLVSVVMEELIASDELMHDRINMDELDSILYETLLSQGIEIEYEFAVFNSKTDSLFSKKNIFDLEKLKRSELKAALFPNDIFNNSSFLVVNFPSQTTFLYKQIWSTLLASALFLIIIIGCFAYSIYIIFRQKKLSEVKNDFINNMTHELKTPIATVSLAVEALNEKEMRGNETTLLRYLGIIKEENNRLFNQVEKVLQSAQLDKEKLILKMESFSIHELITNAVEKSMITIESKEGKLNLDLAATNDQIFGDRHHLTNVLHNLIDNAIKYSQDTPKLLISTKNLPNGIEMEVQDKGIGMTKDTLKRIFDKFYRVSTGDRHDVKGFGLGLSYVKAIIEQHGGEIKVDSELGKGSSFKIYLPHGE
jgi:two-component system phosphate regulon sensor histidine kinase PhoR